MKYFVHIEIEPNELHETKGFLRLKDAERYAFHQRRMLKDFFIIIITVDDSYDKQLSILVGPKYRELYGT